MEEGSPEVDAADRTWLWCSLAFPFVGTTMLTRTPWSNAGVPWATGSLWRRLGVDGAPRWRRGAATTVSQRHRGRLHRNLRVARPWRPWTREGERGKEGKTVAAAIWGVGEGARPAGVFVAQALGFREGSPAYALLDGPIGARGGHPEAGVGSGSEGSRKGASGVVRGHPVIVV
jgi:hypothetical protein